MYFNITVPLLFPKILLTLQPYKTFILCDNYMQHMPLVFRQKLHLAFTFHFLLLFCSCEEAIIVGTFACVQYHYYVDIILLCNRQNTVENIL